MQNKEILDVITSNPNEEYRIIDESGRCFWAVPEKIVCEDTEENHTVISVRMSVRDGIDSEALLVGYPLPDGSGWSVNLHYFAPRLPEMESVDEVTPSDRLTGDL